MSAQPDALFLIAQRRSTPADPSANAAGAAASPSPFTIESIGGLAALGTCLTLSFCAGMVYGVATDGLRLIPKPLRSTAIGFARGMTRRVSRSCGMVANGYY